MNSKKINNPLRLNSLGKSGIRVTELGFGGIPIMRLTVEEARLVIKHCYDLGIRLFDTAHVYGDSEEKLGKALAPFRDQVIIATKVWSKDGKGAADQLAMSLDRLGTDYIDLIQCHSISKQEDLEKAMGPGGAYEALTEAKAKGQVRAIGFSSHNPDIAAECCRLGKFDSLQFPFNFIENDPLEKVFPAALEQGMGVIAMKPLGGGLLERADLCFRFLQEYPEVIPIPGIQSTDEIDEIISFYQDRRPLSPGDWEKIREIRGELGTRFCHRCEYCMPCEQGVQIPQVLMVKTQVRRFGFKQVVAMAKDKIATVENCIECGECVERCPYDLPIPDMLQESLEIYQKFLDKH